MKKINRRRHDREEQFCRKDDFDWDVTSYTEGEIARTREIVLTEEEIQKQALNAARRDAEARLEEAAYMEDYSQMTDVPDEISDRDYVGEGVSFVEEAIVADRGRVEPEEMEYTGEPEEPEEMEYTGEPEELEEIEYTGEPEELEEIEYIDEPEQAEETAYMEEDEASGEELYDEPAYAEAEEAYEEGLEYIEDYSGIVHEGDPADDFDDGVIGSIWQRFLHTEGFDKVMMAAGAAVLILVVVTAVLFVNARRADDQLAEFVSVGKQLDNISVIGEKGLLAVADARLAKIAAANAVEEELEEEPSSYDEADYENAVTVKLNMTSVMKDLKIKFTNKDTGKLIANVPFSVAVTDPDGRTEIWKDDDKDGIIYKKNITPGKYKVAIEPLEGEEYEKYTLPSVAETIEVKKDIAYEKIDVSDEVKTEAEINVAKEDTKVNETVVESTLTDTVQWVESTTAGSVYTEVSKSSIPDPATLLVSGAFLRMSSISDGNSENPNKAFQLSAASNTAKVMVGKQTTVQMTAADYTQGAGIRYSVASSSNDVATATVDANGLVTIKGVKAGTARLTLTADYASGNSAPSNTVSIDVTVTNKKTLTLSKSSTVVYLTEPTTLQATVTDDTAGIALTAASADTNVATVSVNGRTVTITGVAEGSTVITVTYIEDGDSTSANCTVTVKQHPKNDKTTLLKDVNGNQLYVLENEKYREAVYADYYTASQFFKKAETKYTGWQTIDGKVYYFDADGKKVTGEQVIQGAKYNFASDGTLVVGTGSMGIDVSKWNGTIDWKAVKNSGISYVIIRCGYRGSSQGMLVEDPKFKSNIKGATDAGLKVGVYFFTQAVDEVEAVEEASFVLDVVKNYRISYPVFLDVESSGGRGDKIDKTTRTAVCKAFCETVKRGGYTSGIYANKNWLTEKIDPSALSSYKIWLAQYAASPTYTGRYDMWQYKSTGKVSGINGNVDLNLSYLGY